MGDLLVTSLEELIIETRIGVSEEERSIAQKIKISFQLHQKNLKLFESDDSTDYNCYAKISKKISDYCTNNSFKLIEYLCMQLHALIKDNVSSDTLVCISVEKVGIEYDGINFNAKAEYSDL